MIRTEKQECKGGENEGVAIAQGSGVEEASMKSATQTTVPGEDGNVGTDNNVQRSTADSSLTTKMKNERAAPLTQCFLPRWTPSPHVRF